MSSKTVRRDARAWRLAPIDISIVGSHGFLEAYIAACSMVAHADGELASDEKLRALLLAENEPRLAGFRRQTIIDAFDDQAASYALDPELAGELAAEKIRPMASRRRDAHAIVEACRKMIPADGVLHPAELRALDKVRRLLGFEPDDGARVWVGAPPRRPAAARAAA